MIITPSLFSPVVYHCCFFFSHNTLEEQNPKAAPLVVLCGALQRTTGMYGELRFKNEWSGCIVYNNVLNIRSPVLHRDFFSVWYCFFRNDRSQLDFVERTRRKEKKNLDTEKMSYSSVEHIHCADYMWHLPDEPLSVCRRHLDSNHSHVSVFTTEATTSQLNMLYLSAVITRLIYEAEELWSSPNHFFYLLWCWLVSAAKQVFFKGYTYYSTDLFA